MDNFKLLLSVLSSGKEEQQEQLKLDNKQPIVGVNLFCLLNPYMLCLARL